MTLDEKVSAVVWAIVAVLLSYTVICLGVL